ncbi:MAG: AAA family ATPase [Candidatus Omnitrophica bacterium]|nr:AAA family ATPase [Candidatus Omnitrophota bacterium]
MLANNEKKIEDHSPCQVMNLDNIKKSNDESSIQKTTYKLPPSPKSIYDTGLTFSFIRDLILKHIYRFGTISGYDIANKISLPFVLIDEVLNNIISDEYAEKRGSRGLGNATDLFSLLTKGVKKAQELLGIDTYIGPAPVPLEHYTDYFHEYAKYKIDVSNELLRKSWQTIILDDTLFNQVGPAIRSKSSLFLYGPPGTGKSVLAKSIGKYVRKKSQFIAIPHALLIGGQIMRLFDPVYHVPVKDQTDDGGESHFLQFNYDRRWVRCYTPIITVAGDFTLDMLEARYNDTIKYHEAPIHMKSNGGVFVIDDFGRQKESPERLLNRWILPLEERYDILTLHHGIKFPVPFEQFVIFATNLKPSNLLDEAFLRRIRYKIHIGKITISAYKQIFEYECELRDLKVNETDLNTIIDKYYILPNNMLRACDPKDIANRIVDYCEYNNKPKTITYDILDNIYHEYLNHKINLTTKKDL